MSSKLQTIRNSHSNPGPTSDMSSRIARMRKVQTQVYGGSSGKATQFYGHQMVNNKIKGTSGDSSQHLYFRGIFGKYIR